MAEITASRDIESSKLLTNDVVLECVRQVLMTNFDKVKIKNGNQFVCRVKTRLFNPVVSLKGTIDWKAQGGKGKVIVLARPVTNGWFWFTFMLGFVPPTVAWFFGLLWWMWASQKKKTIECLKNTMDETSFKLWNQYGASTSPSGGPPSGDDVTAQLARLTELHKSGALSDMEFSKAKEKLLMKNAA